MSDVKTPYLFPVTFLMTGGTARGGAVWKYILQADEQHGLMRRNVPILSDVLHFLDYGVSPNGVRKWRTNSIRELYRHETGVNYTAPIFLDSGGFRLMWRIGLDLSKFGIHLERDREVESIFNLQTDLGANIIASLDYPLPPGLSKSERSQRMKRSRQNAIELLRCIRDRADKPFVYLAVHGLTIQAMSSYVRLLFNEIENEGLEDLDFGVAIGSLVPLRGASRLDEIVQLVLSARQAIPDRYKQRIPVHIFGLSGLLMPFLAYCGVDTFDSSTYMQESRALSYIDHATRRYTSILDMEPEDFRCQCEICQGVNLREMQEALIAKTNHKPLPSGQYKSKYYSDIALHNLVADTNIVGDIHAHIEADSLDEYLIETTDRFPKMTPVLDVLIKRDPALRKKAARRIVAILKPTAKHSKPVQLKTLTHTPDHFNINADGYCPSSRSVLLIVPCSSEKPYSASTTHQFLAKHLESILPDWATSIHKVTLSGLYGPVPVEYEDHGAVLDYDFRLLPENSEQIDLCTERLVEYLTRHKKVYTYFVAYGTSNAYRTVFLKAARKFNELIVLPTKPKAKKLTEFFRDANIEELIRFLQEKLLNPVEQQE